MTDPNVQEVVDRDALSKTLVEAMVDAHPDLSDEQIADRIRNHTWCPDKTMTPETVEFWRERMARS